MTKITLLFFLQFSLLLVFFFWLLFTSQKFSISMATVLPPLWCLSSQHISARLLLLAPILFYWRIMYVICTWTLIEVLKLKMKRFIERTLHLQWFLNLSCIKKRNATLKCNERTLHLQWFLNPRCIKKRNATLKCNTAIS